MHSWFVKISSCRLEKYNLNILNKGYYNLLMVAIHIISFCALRPFTSNSSQSLATYIPFSIERERERGEGEGGMREGVEGEREF